MSSFVWKAESDFSRIECPILTEMGIEHGLTGVGLSFLPERFGEDCRRFCEAISVKDLLFLKQVHGAEYALIREGGDNLSEYSFMKAASENPYEGFPSGDAFIVKRRIADCSPQSRVAVAIRTGDCVPLIVATENYVAVIHAGWRGIAAEIVPRILQEIRALEQDLSQEPVVICGPCVGAGRYQVGPEVLSSIGSSAIFSPDETDSERSLLHMTATIEQQLQSSPESSYSEFLDVGICTIESRKFHSYRRDKELAGRNLCYVVV